MAARLNCLLKARSGIRPEPLELLKECLNRGVVPVVPSQGSVGASGDLAPLAHVALVLIGEGLAWRGDRRVSGAAALVFRHRVFTFLQAEALLSEERTRLLLSWRHWRLLGAHLGHRPAR